MWGSDLLDLCDIPGLLPEQHSLNLFEGEGETWQSPDFWSLTRDYPCPEALHSLRLFHPPSSVQVQKLQPLSSHPLSCWRQGNCLCVPPFPPLPVSPLPSLGTQAVVLHCYSQKALPPSPLSLLLSPLFPSLCSCWHQNRHFSHLLISLVPVVPWM